MEMYMSDNKHRRRKEDSEDEKVERKRYDDKKSDDERDDTSGRRRKIERESDDGEDKEKDDRTGRRRRTERGNRNDSRRKRRDEHEDASERVERRRKDDIKDDDDRTDMRRKNELVSDDEREDKRERRKNGPEVDDDEGDDRRKRKRRYESEAGDLKDDKKERSQRNEGEPDDRKERRRQENDDEKVHKRRKDEHGYKDRVDRHNDGREGDRKERRRDVEREKRVDGDDDNRKDTRQRVGDDKYGKEKSRKDNAQEDAAVKANEDSKVQKQDGNLSTDLVAKMGRSGGVYIPPFKLARMMKDVQDKSSVEYQRMTWDALRKSINGLVNKVNAANLKNIIPELFAENLIRGRGLFCRSCMKSQMASPGFTDVFAALVAVVNTKFPEVGDLLLRRIILQLQRAYKRNDKPQLLAAVKFIAHLVNQQIVHELIALELLTVLLEKPTDDSVEVAVGFVTECGSMLLDLCPRGLHGIFERFRGILHEGEIDKRVQFLIESLFALRKAKFQGFPAVRPELDLVEQEDQLTHEVSLSETIDPEISLDIFKPDPNFLENERKYEELKKAILGDESEEEGNSDAESEDDDEDEESEEEDEEQMKIKDETETNLINLRRTIYLTIMSSVDFEEAGHKLLKIKLEPGQEVGKKRAFEGVDNSIHLKEYYSILMLWLDVLEGAMISNIFWLPGILNLVSLGDWLKLKNRADVVINFVLRHVIYACIDERFFACQERTYLRYYGLLGQRFCMINRIHQENFEKCFVQQYSMIHRLETNKLRNVAKFFAHLLGTDALPWHCLAYIRLTEEDTTSSSRIFIKILFQELSEHLGIRLLNERLNDPTMQDSLESIFPKDNPKNTRFAINFFTSIGLGGITENLREYLKNMPRLIMQQQKPVSESDESGSSSDSESSGSESESTSSSSEESDDSRRKRRRSRRSIP
ncbi:hypothetical protein RND71_027532 [Anisodus tanguticus]|uniref:MI domain-containing protein n=1 Tax=Anisodus tanguticus TaxID=243964 RepID=A0AAE1V865_9SOLA|nr:hypothetical protein RND71_027532 [Anisodus tanguticus]